MSNDERMRKRQKALADFGDFALGSEDLDAVLAEACRLVGEALGTGRAKVLEIEPGGESLLVRAGVGWPPGVVGRVRVPMRENSSESFSIRAGEPVVTQDIVKEDRFEVPDFLKKAGIVALASVPIVLAGRRAYGLLRVDDTKPRDFDGGDTEFLRTYASVLGRVIDRLFTLRELRRAQERQMFLLRLSDTMRTLDDPVAIQGEAARLLREHFDAGWCYYVEWDRTGTVGTVLRDSTREGLPSMVGVHDVSDAPEFTGLLRAGKLLNVSDFSRFPLFNPRVVERYTSIGIHSVLGPSLVKRGRLIATLSLADTTPRDWSEDDAVLVGEVAERTWAALERARADAALRESEERFRAIVETATDYAILTTDPEGRIETWAKGAEMVFGWTAEEAVGRSVDMTFTPEDLAAGRPEQERQEARETGQAPNVRWHLCKDRSRVFIDGMMRPLHGADGLLRGFVKVGQDVTERRATAAALRENEARFQQFGDASADVLWIRDAETLRFEYVSPSFAEVYGAPLDRILEGNDVRRWAELILPEDRAGAFDHLRRVSRGEHVLHSFRILRSDGQVRWIRDTAFPLLDEAGRVQRIGGIAHDSTEEVELQDRLRVLVAELQHRTRNLMGVVRSVTDRTLAGSTSLRDFQGRIRDRLNALARVNGLLSRLDGGRRITFGELLLTELMAHGVVDSADPASQVTLEGPEGVRLRSSTVQTLALALHELATNALKHGALSRPEGRLLVSWALVDGRDGKSWLRVDWRESGVPVPTGVGDSASRGEPAAPSRRGYGRELIERALPYQLKAETSYELTPEGVRCTITLPLSSTLGATGPTSDGSDA